MRPIRRRVKEVAREEDDGTIRIIGPAQRMHLPRRYKVDGVVMYRVFHEVYKVRPTTLGKEKDLVVVVPVRQRKIVVRQRPQRDEPERHTVTRVFRKVVYRYERGGWHWC